jgi:hypothetical protein
MKNLLKLPLALLVALTLALAAAGPAVADDDSNSQSVAIAETTESRETCNYPVIENPFTKFGDYLDYVLAPDGSFEGDVAGWQLAGGAKVVESDKGRSLQLPKGASAISPSMCLDLNFPHFRMYHRVVKPRTLNGVLSLVSGDADDAEIKVDVIYHEVSNPRWTELKKFDGKQGLLAGSWRLSEKIDLKPDLGGSEPGARQAALRFTAVDAERNESFLLDDVYVDPMRR